jgi:hypothetical protein
VQYHRLNSRVRRSFRPLLLAPLAGLWIGGGLADSARAADRTFNVTLLAQSDPLRPNVFPNASSRIYGDIWVDGNYAYLGSDVNGGGVSIFDISVPSNPTFIRNPANLTGPVTMPTYLGDQMEDIEVYNGIGYFGSDTNVSTGTGVDIVDLSDPTNPVRISRIDSTLGGHNKVHTLSYYDGFLYTSDNATDTIKIFDVTDPGNPQFRWTLDMGLSSGQLSHEVVVKNGRMYVASKNNSSTAFNSGTTTIFDVSNVAASAAPPPLMKQFFTGAGSHTSMPSEDGKLLVVAQERANGDVLFYDISMIDQANDPDAPVLLSTINRTSVGIDAHSPHHPHLHGDMLMLSWYEAGLTIFNIADPTNPIFVGGYDTYPGTSTSYNGNWGNFVQLNSEGILQNVFISDRSKGLMVLDVSDAASTGDFNQDNIVDGADFLAWQRHFGAVGNATLAMGDGNRDKQVGSPDLDVWKFQYGESGAHHAVTAVPEASSLWLALTGLMAAAGKVRRAFGGASRWND